MVISSLSLFYLFSGVHGVFWESMDISSRDLINAWFLYMLIDSSDDPLLDYNARNEQVDLFFAALR